MPFTSFTAELSDGWDMYLLAEEQWNDWAKEPSSLSKALLSSILGNHVLDWTWYRNCDCDPLPAFVSAMSVTKKGINGYYEFREKIFNACSSTKKLKEIADGVKHAYLSQPKSVPVRDFQGGAAESYLPLEAFSDFDREQALDLQKFPYKSVVAQFTEPGGHARFEDIGDILRDALTFWRSFYVKNLPHRVST